MQIAWYYFLRWYVRLGLRFYFKDIIIHGRENIPKGPVIFAANHQNAFMDALMIICFNPHIAHSLTRADIFKKPFAKWMLSTLNMIPIYRIRDGWKSLGENEKTFNECYMVLSKNRAIIIFPEGNHDSKRRVRATSKGFTRIAFDSFERVPSIDTSVIPVGLNYTDPHVFGGSVSIYFGKPLVTRNYASSTGANSFRDDLEGQLKQLTTHVEDESSYYSTIAALELSNPDYLDPIETNQRIEKIRNGTILLSSQKKDQKISSVLHYAATLINIVPLLVWWKIRKGIKDPVFVSSVRFGVGISLFPAFYIISGLFLFFLFGSVVAGSWLLVAMPSMFLYKRRPV